MLRIHRVHYCNYIFTRYRSIVFFFIFTAPRWRKIERTIEHNRYRSYENTCIDLNDPPKYVLLYLSSIYRYGLVCNITEQKYLVRLREASFPRVLFNHLLSRTLLYDDRPKKRFLFNKVKRMLKVNRCNDRGFDMGFMLCVCIYNWMNIISWIKINLLVYSTEPLYILKISFWRREPCKNAPKNYII